MTENGVFGTQEILPGSAVYVPRKIEKEDKTLSVAARFVNHLGKPGSYHNSPYPGDKVS